jgi:hypothetical protein
MGYSIITSLTTNITEIPIVRIESNMPYYSNDGIPYYLFTNMIVHLKRQIFPPGIDPGM